MTINGGDMYYKIWERSRGDPSQWLTQNIRHEYCEDTKYRPIDFCNKLLLKVPQARYAWSHMECKHLHEVYLPTCEKDLRNLKWRLR